LAAIVAGVVHVSGGHQQARVGFKLPIGRKGHPKRLQIQLRLQGDGCFLQGFLHGWPSGSRRDFKLAKMKSLDIG
jgi:hypothetical protein